MNQRVDTLIIGGGVAGLFAAWRASAHGSVLLATKESVSESNTRYAQGGIAAVLFDDDSVESHIADTLVAGAGLCNEEAVRVLCSEGPQRVRDLIAVGVAFDQHHGDLARGMEAAHSSARVIHAGGDATGAEVQRGLERAVQHGGVVIEEHLYLIDLIASETSVRGAQFLNASGERVNIYAEATVLATGGAGQAYRFTTNPAVATGDGVAAAFRAGACIADPEMYQFHPTLLAGAHPFLVSEAVRGEGAVLRNSRGERFMTARHPMAELAPRDVVARAIAEQMSEQHGDPVVLDATALGATFLARRFPTIDAHCRDAGFDWAATPVPVTPAAHFWMGGILTDTWGRTSLDGLYAIGEAACTGVHGANRLASNSLLEGLVFGDRVVRGLLGEDSPSSIDTFAAFVPVKFEGLMPDAPHEDVTVDDVKRLAWDDFGLVRNEHGLRIATKQLALWASALPDATTRAEWELRNLLTISQLIASAATRRKESRGAHFRTDFPHTDHSCAHHTVLRRQP